jgi:hypothetical protein
MDIVYLPQVHTFQTLIGIESQENICNYLIEKFEENPNKHYYIFFESGCRDDDFLINPDMVINFMKDFEEKVNALKQYIPEVGELFKTFNFENIYTRTWLADVNELIEFTTKPDQTQIETLKWTYDKYRRYSQIYGLRWVHEHVMTMLPYLNVTYIPVPCFQKTSAVENKLKESEIHYQNDILAVIQSYKGLEDVEQLFVNLFENKYTFVDLIILNDYHKMKNITNILKSYNIKYPPSFWTKQTQDEFEDALHDAVYSDITVSNREYLTIKDIQQYIQNIIIDDDDDSKFFLIFGVSHDFERWNGETGMFLNFIEDDTVIKDLIEDKERVPRSKPIQHYKRKSIEHFVHNIA